MTPQENKNKVGRPKSKFYLLVPDLFAIQHQNWRHAYRVKEFSVNGDKKETISNIERYIRGNNLRDCHCFYGEKVKLWQQQ